MPAYKNKNRKFADLGVFGGMSRENITENLIPMFRRMALEDEKIKSDPKKVEKRVQKLKNEFLEGLEEI